MRWSARTFDNWYGYIVSRLTPRSVLVMTGSSAAVVDNR